MDNKEFKYTYKALSENEKHEIEYIRNQYKPKTEQESNLQKLRTLDAKVKNSAIILPLIIGVIGTLIFGVGLTLILELKIILWGVILCAVGLIPISIAYPLSCILHAKSREKYGDEILKLSNQLLDDEQNN